MLNDKNKMHPQDIRNLIVFALVSIVLWSAYEIMVLQPQREAAEKRAHIQKVIAKKEAETGVSLSAKPVVQERGTVLSGGQRLQFENEAVAGSINLTGGRIDDLTLKQYYQTLKKEKRVEILSPNNTAHPRFVDYGWVTKDSNIALPGKDTRWGVVGNDRLGPDNPVTLQWDNGQGLTFERVYTLDENYGFSINQTVINRTDREIQIFPYGLITQTGLPANLSKRWIMHEGPIGFIGEELLQYTYSELKKARKAEKTASQGWIGITDKYWLTSLVPDQGEPVKYRFNYVSSVRDDVEGKYQVDYTGRAVTIAAGQSAGVSTNLYAGAKEVLVLNEYGENLGAPNFDLAVDFGWFWFMTKPFFHILHFLHEAIGNMGLAIIALTIMIRMAVFPLTNTSYRSFAKMKKVSPQILELREKYGDDKQHLQQEIIKLYQKEGVNPMAGCLPIIIQIPIFFSLYKVFFVTIEMRHEPFFGWINDLSARDPTSVFNLFGLLPYPVPEFLLIGVWPCLMLLAMLVQKKLNPPPQDKFQRDLMAIFPFFIAFIMSKFASGLVIYWTFSALISVLQQMFIMHRLGVPIHILGQTEEEEEMEEALEKGPDVHPLSAMAEDEAEHALFDEHGNEIQKEISPPKPKKSKKKKK